MFTAVCVDTRNSVFIAVHVLHTRNMCVHRSVCGGYGNTHIHSSVWWTPGNMRSQECFTLTQR